jgi:site-specific DNA-cytosine methylase
MSNTYLTISTYCIACRSAMTPVEDRDGWWICANGDCPAYDIPRPESLTARGPHGGVAKIPVSRSSVDLMPRSWRQAARTSTRPPVLVINGYVGSLVLAAKSIGCEVVGSYEHEDRADGLDVQRLNFPDLSYANSRRRWPDDDLAGAVVVAQPPCAAFSSQNRTEDRGTGASTFERTTETLEYSLSRQADAVLIESVVGALDGARSVHDEFASRHGYRLYRVLQNALSFGVPQDRERFWAVFVREGIAPATVWFHHEPATRTIGDVLLDTPSPVIQTVARRVDRQRAVLIEAIGSVDANQVLTGAFGYGPIRKLIARAVGCSKLSTDQERHLCLGTFRADQIKVLDPKGVAGVLMHNSAWICRGRALSAIEYKRVMGYPDGYRFAMDDWRRMMSKGVCPPAAAWLLDQVLAWIEGRTHPEQGVTTIEPGGAMDIR